MKFDDLKTVWERETKVIDSNQEFNQAIEKLDFETSRLDRKIKKRDQFETKGSFIAIPLYIVFAVLTQNLITSLGWMVMSIALIATPYLLAKAKNTEVNRLFSIKAYLETEKQKIKKQIRLLDTIGWWALAPLFIGNALVVYGAKDSDFLVNTPYLSIVWIIVTAVIFYIIYFLNQKAIKRDYLPMLEKIDQHLIELENI